MTGNAEQEQDTEAASAAAPGMRGRVRTDGQIGIRFKYGDVHVFRRATATIVKVQGWLDLQYPYYCPDHMPLSSIEMNDRYEGWASSILRVGNKTPQLTLARDNSPALHWCLGGAASQWLRLACPLEQAVHPCFHAIIGIRWTSADPGAGLSIGDSGGEEPNTMRGRLADRHLNDLSHTGGKDGTNFSLYSSLDRSTMIGESVWGEAAYADVGVETGRRSLLVLGHVSVRDHRVLPLVINADPTAYRRRKSYTVLYIEDKMIEVLEVATENAGDQIWQLPSNWNGRAAAER
ncbi:hypothetical protein BJY52DRAFT_1226927 [Lactarius psammicola]|nr:hypothetical protein BJY52DRAFT_1226927 [Lactarius psammicola]